eukprot:s495_g6.t1
MIPAPAAVALGNSKLQGKRWELAPGMFLVLPQGNPCVFHNSLFGCDKGGACDFCHLRHSYLPTGQHRTRKVTRDSFKRRVLACFEKPKDQLHSALQAEALYPYARGLIRGYLDEQAEREAQPLEPGLVVYS